MEKLISVVLADQSEDYRKLLSALIDDEEDMYLLASTGDGCEAAELVARFEPNVLLSGILLHRLGGLELAKILSESTTQTKAILISCVYNRSVAEEAERFGVEHILPKPCSIPRLMDTIRLCAQTPKTAKRPVTDAADRRAPLEKSIDEALSSSGILPNLSGRAYLRAALLAVVEDRELMLGVTKVLYPRLAAEFGTSAANIERGISRAIERAWRDGSSEKRLACFGEEYRELLGKKPGNVLYMKLVLERLDRIGMS